MTNSTDIRAGTVRGPWRAALVMLAAVACTIVVRPGIVAAQAVHPDVTVRQPAPDVSVSAERWLDSERPRVAIYLPPMPPPEAFAERAARIRGAVTDWELLLLGLGIPYTVIDDESLERGPHRDIDVLIVPASDLLNQARMVAVRQYVKGGGGLIAAGVPSDDPAAAAVLAELLGVTFHTLPSDVSGAYHVFDRLPGFATGIPAGQRLNVAVRNGFSAARASTDAISLGSLRPYGSEWSPEFDGLTAAASSTGSGGPVVWTAFAPQDVSDQPDDQRAWQRFAVGALARAGGLSTVALDAWPDGARAALAVAVVPSPGFDAPSLLANTTHLLEFLERESVPATSFLPGAELAVFPGLIERIAAAAEFGVTTRSERPLYGQSPDVQRSRIREGVADLQSTGFGRTADAAQGFLPPGMLLDGSTLQALGEQDFDYVLGPPGISSMPDSLAVHDAVDFRDMAPRSRIAVLPLGSSAADSPDSAAESGMNVGLDQTLRTGGLLVTPYHVEEISPGSLRFEAFERMIDEAQSADIAMMSLSDISRWTAMRRSVRVQIDEREDGGSVIHVHNSAAAVARGIVLRWTPGRPLLPASIVVSDDHVTADVDHASGTVRLALPDLPAGSTLEFRLQPR